MVSNRHFRGSKETVMAGPMIYVSLLQSCLQLISIMFVGHLGELPLSDASMASSFASVTGFSFLMGMSCAPDTFCGQSYVAKQYHMLGIHMQRAMFILSIVSIPLSVIWANTGIILKAVGQDPALSEEAGLYAQYMIPSLFAYGLLQCHVRFFQTRSIVFPMMVTSGISALLHFFICWILVFKSGLGSRGAALALSISYWLNAMLLALYVKFSSSCTRTRTGFSKEALQNIPSFIKLAVPSASMMWSFEMLVLLSGLLPNPQLETSVLSMSLNTTANCWIIPFGLGASVSTRVSNALGAGCPQTAQLAVYVVFAMAITEGILVAIVALLICNVWGYAYSNELEVVSYIASMMPILAGSMFFDSLQTVLSGVVRGCGWQKMGAYINLGSYYIVGLPCAVWFAFVLHIGGKGLWLGIICGLILQGLLYMIFIGRINQKEEAMKAKTRVQDSKIPVDILSHEEF